MAVSRADIVSAYRLLLGREPEPTLDLDAATALYSDVDALRAQMLASAEAGSTLFDALGGRLGGAWVRWPTSFGRQIHLCLSDVAVSKTILLTGDWEPAVGRQILALLAPGDTFLDVGANLGWFSLLAGDRFARAGSGQVVAVEANPTLVAHLGASIVDSGLAAFVTLKPYAVSDRVGLAEMSACAHGNVGGHNIAPAEPGPRHVVPCLRLDDLLGELPRCDLIKLDIEGAEPLAIRGAVALLERHRPKVIMELNRDALTAVAGLTVLATIELMTALGYRPFAVADGPPRPVSAAEVDERVGLHGYWDVLFLP